jgi:signal peptidase I
MIARGWSDSRAANPKHHRNRIIYLALQLLLILIVMIDAFLDARRLRQINLHRYNRWYIYLVIILFQALVIPPIHFELLTASTRAYRMPTGSMAPTLEIGDKVVADMKAYDKKLPIRGDLIVFKYPNDESVSYLKRVIGLPGEKLEIIRRVFYINGRPWRMGSDHVYFLALLNLTSLVPIFQGLSFIFRGLILNVIICPPAKFS